MDPFGLHDGRAALVVLARIGFAGGQQFFLPLRDQGFVLAVGGDDHAQFLGELERVIEFGVVDPKGAFVGQEDLKRADAAADDFPQLIRGARVEARHPHVKGEIAGGFSFGLGQPQFEAGQRLVAARRAAHLDQGGGAADQRGLAPGLISVLGVRAHEGQVNMNVRIDEAGEDELSLGIDDFRAGRGRQVAADLGDGLAGAKDVGDVAGVGGDNLAVFDQQRHRDREVNRGTGRPIV